MEKKSVSKTVMSGLIWTFGERICAQLATLIVTMVLARLLGSEEYAIVGIVNIFITISNVFVTSGFGNALIQKLDADETDFSTTLIFTFAFSCGLYLVLFFGAPVVARMYNMDILQPVLRVMSLRLLFASINTVQHAYISKRLMFRKFFYSTISGTVVSAVVGIVMAYLGFGVWALVAQALSNVMIHTIVLGFTCGWIPSFRFEIKRIGELFSYGWKLLVSELTGTLYYQLQGFILSAVFEPSALSYYNQGEKYPGLFIHNIEASLHKVMFPLISKEQKDLRRVKDLTRKSLRLCIMLIAPCMFGLAGCGESVIELLLTEKWLPCVPYLQIICVAYLLNPIMSAHTRMLKALGRSDVFMRITFVRYISAFVLLVLVLMTVKTPYIVVGVSAVVMFIVCVVCAFVSRKIIYYSFREQLADLALPIVISVVMFGVVRLVGKLEMHVFLLLVLQIAVGFVVYLGLSWLLNRQQLKVCMGYVKRFFSKKR